MRILLLALFTLLPAPANPGPWPRAEGEIYALGFVQGGSDPWARLYAEVGGPRRLTFGLDLGGHLQGPEAERRVRAFLRVPLDVLPAPWRAAVETGFGQDMPRSARPVARASLGVSAGRGFETAMGGGWTAFALRAEAAADGTAPTRLTASAVAGIRPAEGWTVELGAFAESEGDDTSVTLAPTVQRAMGGIGDLRLGVALSEDGAALRLGLAREF
ncbi:hypothetical protein [Jannaschia sp. W003]|uniref:hypothetical protein n=1 Tax=Jannaschia sp. W003 TaxID=2867012 RepID=UPI0021A83BB3|nr:hypothetical protein [Jannaschia sp. W003]UWQ21808.1 hypothetical protein K3554_01910 [Jannaschia sp. W003]